MEIKRIVPNISSDKMEESKVFYSSFLGLRLAMDRGWMFTFVSEEDESVQLSILHSPKPPPVNHGVTITIEVSDIEGLYKKAVASKYDITYPLTEEEWGVRRFFIIDPNGVTINLMCHIDLTRWN